MHAFAEALDRCKDKTFGLTDNSRECAVPARRSDARQRPALGRARFILGQGKLHAATNEPPKARAARCSTILRHLMGGPLRPNFTAPFGLMRTLARQMPIGSLIQCGQRDMRVSPARRRERDRCFCDQLVPVEVKPSSIHRLPIASSGGLKKVAQVHRIQEKAAGERSSLPRTPPLERRAHGGAASGSSSSPSDFYLKLFALGWGMHNDCSD